MYFTHRFSRPETLNRVHTWLTDLGFKPHQMEVHKHGAPRIALAIQPPQWAEVSLVIHTVERAGLNEYPGFEMASGMYQALAGEGLDATDQGVRAADSAAIGWHPLD